MRMKRIKPTRTEWGMLGLVAAVIGGEAAAVAGGLGPVAAVVALGYLVVFGLVYLAYRSTKRPLSAQSARVSTAADLASASRPPGPAVAASSGAGGTASGKPVALNRLLRDVDIFRGLTAEQVDAVAVLGQPVDVSAGQQLVQAGESGDLVFVIVQGRAQLSAQSAIGDITVRVAGPGESFPLAAMLGAGTLITSATAMTDMKMLAIPRSSLFGLCAEDPEIGMRIYAAIGEVLGNRYRKTLERLTASAEEVLREVEFFANV